MATVRVWFEVDVPLDDAGPDSKAINELIDTLGQVDTNLAWDNVEWQTVFVGQGETNG